jgi:integrase
VLGTSSKGKVPVKPKLIARRSPEEAQFLEDIASYVARSGATGRDELFSFRKEDGTKVPLRSRTVREELKRTCESNGLPPAYFSSHSLRKGAITHMRAAGATEEDRRDRGNYSAGSQVMNQTYDYAVGLGPLASNSLPGARRLGLRDVKRLIPAKRNSM